MATTITGNVKTLLGVAVISNCFVRFYLRGCNGAQARVSGTALIPPANGTTWYIDIVPDGSGALSGSAYSNDVDIDTTLTPGQHPTWYGVVIYQNGIPGPETPYNLANGATFNLNTATPLTTVPAVSAPTGDTTYIRSDGGNSPVTGALTFKGAIKFKNIENERIVDSANSQGWAGADMGAWINSAVADIGSGTSGTIRVADGGGTLSTLVTLGKLHKLIFGTGTYTHKGIRLPDSTIDTTGSASIIGKGSGTTTLLLAASASVDSISSTNFGTLTGGTNNFGVFHVAIEGLTVDGNSANNASGFGIRLYGRGVRIRDVIVQNAKQDGWWPEWGGTQGFSDSSWDLEWSIVSSKAIYCGGNGFTNKTNDISLIDFVSQSNGGWGIESFRSIFCAYVNTYVNTSGGWHVSGESVAAVLCEFTNALVVGLLLDTGAGACQISSSTFGGGGGTIPIGIEVRSSNHHISGFLSGATTAGIKFNGAGAVSNHFSLAMFNNSCPQLLFTSGGNDSTIILSGSAPVGGSTSSGTFPQSANAFINISRGAGNLIFNQFSTQSFNAGGWNPQFPNSNGVLNTGTGTTNKIPKYTTGASAILGDSTITDNGTTVTCSLPLVNINLGGSGSTTPDTGINRLHSNRGTALLTSDVSAITNFGNTALCSAINASDTAGTITITSQGTGQAANGTFLLTFKDGTWTNPPIVIACRGDGNGPIAASIATTPTATQILFTFLGLPVNGTAYVFNYICIGR